MAKNFDTIIERRGTDSLKFDGAPLHNMPDGLLPLWVADMDFHAADPIAEAMKSATDHGIFGYVIPGEDYFDAVRTWFKTRHSYDFSAETVTLTPGIVFALAQAVRAFSEPGDAILVQRPVYYPFSEVINNNARRLVNSPLVLNENGKYEIDFEDFERRLHEDKPSMFILCSPHNPVGRVWAAEELKRMGELCLAYNCLVVADEIHADFVYEGNRHTVFSTISNAFRDNSIVCTAPSKSFNLAGLQISNIVIENEEIRKRFAREVNACGYSQPNVFGLAAGRAAYANGGPWFDELMGYITENLSLVRSFFPASIKKVDRPALVEPEGTYLPWIDFRGLGIPHDEVDSRLITEAEVWLDSGTMFGPEGTGFQRINVACPRSVLKDALTRISNTFCG